MCGRYVYNLNNILKIQHIQDSCELSSRRTINNQAFRNFYTGAMAIAVTVFALFIIWKFVNKLLDPDEETTFKIIIMEIVKCGSLIMLSTFLFVQVSNFSISLSNYTGSIFESSNNATMSNTMLTMFISYKDSYKNSDKFDESKSIADVVKDGSFDNDELYLSKYVTKAKIIFLGDYIDRGGFSFEIVITLFTLICKFPSNIVLLRGNHEFDAMCSLYGFKKEILNFHNPKKLYHFESEQMNDSPTTSSKNLAFDEQDQEKCLHYYICIEMEFSENVENL